MTKKKVTVPEMIIVTPDPEMEEKAYAPTGKMEGIETSIPTAPALVLELAHKVGEEPWTWFVAEDHVTIVMRSGKKYRFERE